MEEEEEPILLGEGSHGCVFSSIKCDNEQIRSELGENYVVKVLNKEDGEKEIKEYAKINSVLAGIPNVEKYMVLKQKRCDYTEHTEVKKYISEHTTCKRPEIFIGYEYGGYELEKMLQKRVNLLKKNPAFYKNLFVLFLYVIKALDILNTNNLSYFDFKTNNITYNKEKNVLKLIDIGSASLTDQVNAEMISKGIGTIGYMPPELLIFPSEKNEGVVNFFPGFFKFKNLSLKKEGGDQLILTSPELDNNKEPISSINLTYYNKELSNYKRCYKSDMWSLGTTLLYLRSIAYDDKEEEEEEKYKLEQIDFKGLDELIIALLQLDVDKRINSVTALEMYKSWIIGEGLASPEQVEQIVNPVVTSSDIKLVLEGGRRRRRYTKKQSIKKRISRLKKYTKKRKTNKKKSKSKKF